MTNDIDSLFNLINKKKIGTEKIELLIELSEKFAQNGNKKALDYLQWANRIADSINNYHFRIQIYKKIGINWRNWGDNYKSIDSLYQALLLTEKSSEYHKERADIYRNMGESYRAVGVYDKAIEYLKKAEDEFPKFKDSVVLAKTYNRYAAVYFEMATNELDDYFRKLNIEKDSASLLNIYQNVLTYKQKYDLAIKHVNKAIELSKSLNLIETIVSTNNILATLYRNTMQFEEAKKVYSYTIDLVKKNNITSELPLLMHNFAGLFYINKDYKNALILAKESYEFSMKYDYKVYQYLSAGLLNNIYKQMGNFEKANYYLELFYQTRMEYFKNDLDNAIKINNIENEAKKKQQEFEYQEKRKKNILITLLVFFGVVLVFVAFLIINNKKIKSMNFNLQNKNQIIEVQKDKLELMNVEKDKFFSIIAHDLKNPLGTFKNLTEMMYDMPEDFTEDERQDFIKLMKDSAGNVYSLLENLLEWSRSQRGKITFNPVEINFYDIVRLTINTLNPTAQTKKISLLNNVEQNLNILADPNLLNTVIRNLISNAIKFTPEGGTIEIGAIKKPSEGLEPSEGSIHIYVKDSGVGMNEETINKLFRIDVNITSQGTSGEKGTGLGLILCKEFVEKHGGKIWVESELGKGSTFWFSLLK